jgi:preprotein translocase subunit SecD
MFQRALPMLRHPTLRYVVTVVALVLGFVYALPNIFPEAPAVQISSSQSGVKIDAVLLEAVESALKDAGIASAGGSLDPTGINVRLADPDTQSKAKDALQAKLGDNYIVALSRLSSSPAWLASIGALPLYLGLDLRGGVYFLLQVDSRAAVDKAIDRHAADIRALLREKKVQYSGIAREGSNIFIHFRDGIERTRARSEIGRAVADVALRELEGTDGEVRLVVSLAPDAAGRIRQNAVEQNAHILCNRVNALGVAEPVIPAGHRPDRRPAPRQ